MRSVNIRHSRQSRPGSGRHLLAFIDDTHVVSQPERSCEIHGILRAALWNHSRIQLHTGKLQMWNRVGIVPRGHDALLAAAQIVDPTAQIWFGDHDAPAAERGIRVLGTPLGERAYVEAQLQRTVEEHRHLLARIPTSAIYNRCGFCSSFALQHAPISSSGLFIPVHQASLRQHDIDIWSSGHPPRPFMLGGGKSSLLHGWIGVAESRTAVSVHWASWADCQGMIQERHATIADLLIRSLDAPLEAAFHLSGIPTNDLFRFLAQFFRLLLLRRLWLPLPLSSHTCRCGRPLDVFGHSMPEGRGFGFPWVFVGDCSCPGVPGSRSSGVCQCLPSRLGPPSAVHRRSAARDSGRWIASLRRRPTRCGHHVGVCHSRRRSSPPQL